MNNRGSYFLGVCIILSASIFSLLHGQAVASFGVAGIGVIAPTVSQCPTNTASSTSPMAYLCPVGSGTTYQLYVSYNGGAYSPLVGTASGVTSFNGRTGAVVPVAGDYTYTQLSGPPTKVVSGNFSLTGASITP